jgi:hypothetical protein
MTSLTHPTERIAMGSIYFAAQLDVPADVAWDYLDHGAEHHHAEMRVDVSSDDTVTMIVRQLLAPRTSHLGHPLAGQEARP